MYLIIIEFMQRMSFGKFTGPVVDFLNNNIYVFGFLGFSYGLVLFYGAACARNKIPALFEDFVSEKTVEVLRENPDLKSRALAKKVYSAWVEYVPNMPSKYKIPSEKGFWIVKPTVQMLEETLELDIDKILVMYKQEKFKDNTKGVAISEKKWDFR